MDFTSIPIIVVCSYLVGELYKLIFQHKTNAYKFIPVVTPIVGGILGIAIFLTAPELLGAQTIWNALLLGIVSGASATGANQIIKKIFNKAEKQNDNS